MNVLPKESTSKFEELNDDLKGELLANILCKIGINRTIQIHDLNGILYPHMACKDIFFLD